MNTVQIRVIPGGIQHFACRTKTAGKEAEEFAKQIYGDNVLGKALGRFAKARAEKHDRRRCNATLAVPISLDFFARVKAWGSQTRSIICPHCHEITRITFT